MTALLLADLSNEEAQELLHSWEFWARGEQLAPPGAWYVWLLRSGRGFGKTRVGSEYVKAWSDDPRARIALVGETSTDVRRTMVEGESGLLSVFPADAQPRYYPAKHEIHFASGALAQCFSGDKPSQLRGPQFTHAWVDELMKFRYARESWDNLELAVRLGDDPRIIVTTTPKPRKLLKELEADPDTVTTTGHTFDNRANLPDKTLRRLARRYEGTTLGRQELGGEVLDEVEGSIVRRAMIDAARLESLANVQLVRVVVGVDPSGSDNEEADEVGMVAAGEGVDGHAYVLSDRTGRLGPDAWAQRATEEHDRVGADAVVAEVNFGGDMVVALLGHAAPRIRVIKRHASRGKHVRFEPIGGMYERGEVHHVGDFPELEDEVCGFTTKGYDGIGSPNRADALVWALTELFWGDATGPGWDDLYGEEGLLAEQAAPAHRKLDRGDDGGEGHHVPLRLRTADG